MTSSLTGGSMETQDLLIWEPVSTIDRPWRTSVILTVSLGQVPVAYYR